MTHVLHVSGPYSRWFPRFTKGGEILGRVGTREYLAPEVWSGKYSEKVDIFTAGALGYLCLKGKYPEFSWWRRGWPKCPFQCFWKRPGARPSAAQALAHPFCHAARWEIWVWTYRENSFCWHLGKFRSFQNDFQGSHLATRSSGAWERRSTSPRGPKHTEAVVFFYAGVLRYLCKACKQAQAARSLMQKRSPLACCVSSAPPEPRRWCAIPAAAQPSFHRNKNCHIFFKETCIKAYRAILTECHGLLKCNCLLKNTLHPHSRGLLYTHTYIYIWKGSL